MSGVLINPFAFGAGSPPEPTTLVHDTFTGTNGTALSSHTPDVDAEGGGWSAVPTTTIPEIQGNRAAAPSGVRGAIIDTGQTSYTLTAKLTVGAGSNQYALVYVRFADVSNRWHVEVDAAGDYLRLVETTSGTGTTRDTASATIGAGTYDITVTVTPTSISATVPGIGTVSFSSATHASATHVGLLPRSSVSFVDDFKVTT